MYLRDDLTLCNALRMQLEDDELVIYTAEAAEILGVDRATVSRWAESGKLQVLRKLPGPNGVYLFSAKVVRRKAQEELLRKAG